MLQSPTKTAHSKQLVERLTTVLHGSVVIVALSLACCLFDGSLFAWHPALMSVGYIIFMSEGVLSAVMFRTLDGPERVSAIWSHALLQARAMVCIVAGFVVIYRNKVVNGRSHFLSTHAQVGLATMLLSLGSPLLGLVSFRRMGIIQRFPERLQPRIKWLHRQLGVVTWLMSLVTIQLALRHPAVYKGGLTIFWQVGVGLIAAVMGVLLAKAGAKAKEEDGIGKAV